LQQSLTIHLLSLSWRQIVFKASRSTATAKDVTE
jgi:hypothetical protein